MKKYRRNHNTNLIKGQLSYTILEIAALLKVHKHTVLMWIRQGLPKIDDRKPGRILGSDLKEFLNKIRNDRKAKCEPTELYCLKCRKPRTSRDNHVDINILNEKKLMIVGVCNQCGTRTNRISSVSQLSEIAGNFVTQTIHNKGLIGSDGPIVNVNLQKE